MKEHSPLSRHRIRELPVRTIRKFGSSSVLCVVQRMLLALLVLTFAPASAESAVPSVPDLQALTQMSARFVPTPLKVDTSKLSSGDQQALSKLIQAAQVLNPLFMQQLWSGTEALYKKLQEDKTPLGQARLHYFWINKGPWSDIDEHQAFLPGVPSVKPPGANFYPDDMTKEEFATWEKTLSPEGKTAAEGFFTVIRRGRDHELKYVP